MKDPDTEVLREPTHFHPSSVFRKGGVVYRKTGPWTPAVHALLRHLERVGFQGAPRLVGTGLDDQGHELLTYIPGEFTNTGPWSLEGAAGVGQLLRDVHAATASFAPPPGAVWQRWSTRELGGRRRVISHCDTGPWNIVARNGRPVALIDWEFAGPIDPLMELAETCWLNAKLYDDIVAEREGLPPLAERAKQLRAVVDGYGLPRGQRRGFVDRIIGVAVHATADEADEASIMPDTPLAALDPQVPWALAWRARSAAWMYRHRRTLQSALA
ncbi:MAG TPA: aminoglycoside phosphotransferase family protein [Chloroflexota bacterium]|nr:aminoglycoside phosphotransferase family protein [Chloroflexota bacterium]